MDDADFSKDWQEHTRPNSAGNYQVSQFRVLVLSAGVEPG